MRAGGSKQKGASFERKVCKILSLWLSQGEREDLLWRSAMSGGRATIGLKQGRRLDQQAGDISAISEEGLLFTNAFYIECKSYSNLRIASFLLSNVGELSKFWRQTNKAAKKHNKIPMLIAKQNQVTPIVLVPSECIQVKAHANLLARRADLYILEELVRQNPKEIIDAAKTHKPKAKTVRVSPRKN